ncbi:unnamed protein product [Sphagnum balticum]
MFYDNVFHSMFIKLLVSGTASLVLGTLTVSPTFSHFGIDCIDIGRRSPLSGSDCRTFVNEPSTRCYVYLGSPIRESAHGSSICNSVRSPLHGHFGMT